MSNAYVLFFHQVGKKDVALVGGKGANLGEMTRAGFPVPSGFCLNVQAYQEFMKEGELQQRIQNLLKEIRWDNPVDLEEKSRKIRESFLVETIPVALAEEIVQAYGKIQRGDGVGSIPVAVRSSATAEDLPEASFAGQQETYLYVRGEEELLLHVKKCWASLWSARAMAYRQKQNYAHDRVFLSVVVQQMIPSEVSGVAFSVNPLNQEEKEMVITSSYGLGESVVSGLVTPDTFVMEKRKGTVREQQLGEKGKQIVQQTTGGTILEEVPESLRGSFSLTPGQLGELYQMVKKVEAHYQNPQDIEWTFAGGNLYLLQSRPITTLKKEGETEETLDVYRLSRLQKWILDDLLEHYPDAPTPLDYSVVTISYQALLDSAHRWGMNMSNAKEIICFYEDGRIHLVPPKIRPTFNLLKMPLHIIKSARTNIAPWDSLRDKIDALLSRVEGMKTKESTPKELGKILSELFQKAKEINELRFFYILEASLLPITILSTLLKGSTARKLNITSIEAFTIGLDYKTAVIDRELQRLAVYAHSKPEIKELILIEEFTDFQGFVNQLTQLPEGREFLCRFHEFLRQYGSRTEKMYHPFTSKAWVEDPLYFLNILKATIQDEYLTLREQREQERRVEFNQRMENLEKKLISPVRKLFRWSIRQLRDSYVLREDTVFYLEKLFTAGRGLVKEIGKNLVREGLLENKEDIIYLRESEIYRLLEDQPFEKDSKVLVQIRKEIVSSNQKIWKQNLFNLSGPQGDSDSIEGVMGSPGIAEGPVCVIQRVEDFGKLKKGDILVCPYTDPAWTPLFGLAAGVVSDTGGPLSHAAIVAREYGIPAILGTKVATTYLQDGEVVLVDGGNGKVYKKMGFLITG